MMQEWALSVFTLVLLLAGHLPDNTAVQTEAAELLTLAAAAADEGLHNYTSQINANNLTLKCEPARLGPGGIAVPGFLMTTVFLANDPFAFGCLTSYNVTKPGANGADFSEAAASHYLGVAMLRANFPIIPIWVANRYRAVRDNGGLVSLSGKLRLMDSDGYAIWDADGVTGVVSLNLASDGNLQMLGYGDLVLWQSFDDPLDVLVPGQWLRPGHKLISGFSATYSLISATGNFSAEMKPGGLILYEHSSSSVPLPYYAIEYPFIPSTVDQILSSQCNNTVMEVGHDNITLVQSPAQPWCNRTANNSFGYGVSVPLVAFLRLDPDGNIRAYHRDYKASFDLFQSSSKGLCGIPNSCGPYGICVFNISRGYSNLSSSSYSCRCPDAYIFTQQEIAGKDYLLTATTCSPNFNFSSIICNSSASGYGDLQFLDIQGVDYFANDYAAPSLANVSYSDCKSACAENCSCSALFYRETERVCFLQVSVLSMIHVQKAGYIASIKYTTQRSSSASYGGTSNKSETKLIVGISTASLVAIVVLLTWRMYSKRKPVGSQSARTAPVLPGQPVRFTFKELKSATGEFSQKLGGGGFGSVYKGVLPDGSDVAVKQLENAGDKKHRYRLSAEGLREFRNEVISLGTINHQNLVHLRGFCADGSHRLLVYEYMVNGSLDTWIFRQPGLNWKTRLSIAVHTARGLFFLHEQCRTRIVHLDIKPQNILLDQNFVAKLSDFGLSRLINEDENMALIRMHGTPGYMAPECSTLKDASEKSDIYSFGMVLLEIVSGRKNVDVSRLVLYGDGEGWYFPAMAAMKFQEGCIEDIVDRSLLSDIQDGEEREGFISEASKVLQIAFWCIQDEPSLRPTMGNVLLMLEGYAPVPPSPPLSFQFSMLFHRSNTLDRMQSHGLTTCCSTSASVAHSSVGSTISSPCHPNATIDNHNIIIASSMSS